MTLKELRLSRNLTQEVAAARAGMRPSFYGSLERGQYPNPTLKTIRSLAHALDCTVNQVINAIAETYEAVA